MADLKRKIYEQTNIPPKRQKILNLIKGSLPKDDVTLDALQIPAGKTILVMGTPDDEIFKDPSEMEGLLPEILEDLEEDIAVDAIQTEIQVQREKELARVINEVRSPR